MNFRKNENASLVLKEREAKPVKIGKRHQITIPQELFKRLCLEEGDILETKQEGGKIILLPKRLVDKMPIIKFSKKEQEILNRVRRKVSKIQKDIIHSQGLSNTEVKIAVKAGIIDSDQAYWWHEDWQKGEREVEKSIVKEELAGPFDNIKDALKALKTAKA